MQSVWVSSSGGWALPAHEDFACTASDLQAAWKQLQQAEIINK